MKGVNDNEILDFVELTRNKNIHVRFIEYMPFSGNKWHCEKMVTYIDLVNKICKKYPNFSRLSSNFSDTSKVCFALSYSYYF